MSTPTNTELHRTANILEDVAKLLHQGTEAFRLAEEWAGVGAAAAASDGSRSTRVELDDDMLVAVVNDVHYDFAFEPHDIATLWLSVGPRLVVSARLQPLRSIDRLRDAVRRGEKVMTPVALLVHLMHDQGDVLINIVRNTTARVDEIEDSLLAGRLEPKRANLGALRRLLVRLQRLLAPNL